MKGKSHVDTALLDKSYIEEPNSESTAQGGWARAVWICSMSQKHWKSVAKLLPRSMPVSANAQN